MSCRAYSGHASRFRMPARDPASPRVAGAVNLHALRIAYGDLAGFAASVHEDESWHPTACAGRTDRDLVHHLLIDAQRALHTTRDWLVGRRLSEKAATRHTPSAPGLWPTDLARCAGGARTLGPAPGRALLSVARESLQESVDDCGGLVGVVDGDVGLRLVGLLEEQCLALAGDEAALATAVAHPQTAEVDERG